jgi:short-subunit dehydrogenase
LPGSPIAASPRPPAAERDMFRQVSARLTQVRAGFVARGTAAARGVLAAALTGGGPLVPKPLFQRLFGEPALSEVLSQRTMLVTGASSGIGRATALLAARAGAELVLVARSTDSLTELVQEIEKIGSRARAYPADLASQTSSDALLAQLASDKVAVDVLINSAGRSIRRLVADASDRVHDYERTIAINYIGAVRLTLGLLPGMRERKRGHVINVSSSGVLVGAPMFSAYIASKAALDSFTRIAATEARGHGIRFTNIHMPLVRTPMVMPTPVYHRAPALTVEQAADLVLRPLTTGEAQIGTHLGALINLAHAVAPRAVQGLFGLGQQMLRE